MAFSRYPTQALLDKYGLSEYYEINEACRKGDMQAFE